MKMVRFFYCRKFARKFYQLLLFDLYADERLN